MGYDDILTKIGELGRYQWRIVFFVCVSTLVCPWHLLIQVFFILDTPHYCSTNSWQHTNCSQWDIDPEECAALKKNVSIPVDGTGFAQCEKYNVSSLDFDPFLDTDGLEVIPCDEGWVYDEANNGPSIISKFDLVCDRQGLPQIAQSLFFIGSLFGSVIYGMIADWIGRYPAWCICLLHQFIFGILVIFMPNFWSYTLVRTILAPANYAAWIIPVIMATEYVGPNKRMVSGLFIEYFFASGFMIVTVLAWIIRDWVKLQLTVTLLQCYILLYLPFVPESPRWLVAENRIPEAAKIIKRIAKGNGTTPPPNFEEELREEYQQKKMDANSQIRFIDIFTNRTMLLRTMNMSFAWFAHGLVYFGLTLGASNLGINVYVSFFVSAFVEIPSYTVAMLCLFKFGRKNTTACFMIVGGIICMLVIFAPLGPWRATAAYIGKFAVTTSFVILFVYGAEIFPTPVRGFGVGFCSIMGRLGDIMSPIINLLRPVWPPFPLVLYGIVIIISGIWVFTSLPETRKKDLPETMEDAVNLGSKRQKIPSFDDKSGTTEKL
ncbi:organic cation transporter protein-like [Apostichopus japonicus]|uniref:organic cation transporter protein-like n=1 Tax=Stichopus japonicus TaxID=307972 RepID=UPI003AB50FE6